MRKLNRDASYRQFRERHSAVYLDVMTGITVLLLMIFHILDRVLDLRNTHDLLSLRLGTSAVIIVNVLIAWLLPRSRLHTKVHIYVGFYAIAVHLTVLSHLSGGIYSAHWAGLTFVLVFWLTLVPFSFQELAAHGLIFILQYSFILGFLGTGPLDWRRIMEYNFFFFGAWVIGCIVSFMNNISTSSIFNTQQKLESATKKSEELLTNILPSAITERLKWREGVIADSHADVSILFADIVNFTCISRQLDPRALVDILNSVFSEFDSLVSRYGLEKIKTIGDAYMVIGGAPESTDDHTGRVLSMAVEMRTCLARFSQRTGYDLKLRIGIHTGPVVAGVIGSTRFAYDLWGDTVNTASRMESQGVTDFIQVTEEVYNRMKSRFSFIERGTIFVKGKGPMNTYLVVNHESGRDGISGNS